jgi:WD40 repeat protein
VGHSKQVKSVDFSADGTMLATASADGTARIWRVADGGLVRVFDDGGGSTARFSAGGALLLTLRDGAIRIWRVADGRLMQAYEQANASCLAVASNGKYFAYGRLDGSVVLARMPVLITYSNLVDSTLTLGWEGGAGLYQVQQATRLDNGVWQDVGEAATNTTATLSTTREAGFYRVRSVEP